MKRFWHLFFSSLLGILAVVHLYPQAKSYYHISRINQQRVQASRNSRAVHLDMNLRHGVFLCYGQSNAGNFGSLNPQPTENVYQLCEGEIHPFHVPSCGTGGRGGNPWGQVGSSLVEWGKFDAVTFANASVGGANMRDLASETYLDYLILQHKHLERIFGHVDGILLMQGESDYGNSIGYVEAFNNMLKRLGKYDVKTPIFLSQTSICKRPHPDTLLVQSQMQLAQIHEQVLLGPNTDNINFSGARYDYCHFSRTGLDSLAGVWAHIISKGMHRIQNP